MTFRLYCWTIEDKEDSLVFTWRGWKQKWKGTPVQAWYECCKYAEEGQCFSCMEKEPMVVDGPLIVMMEAKVYMVDLGASYDNNVV